jgi:hypothetical protein
MSEAVVFIDPKDMTNFINTPEGWKDYDELLLKIDKIDDILKILSGLEERLWDLEREFGLLHERLGDQEAIVKDLVFHANNIDFFSR